MIISFFYFSYHPQFIVLSILAVIANASHVHVAAPSFVTAQSSQVVARNFNGIVTPAILPVSPFLPPKVFGAYIPHSYPFSPFYYPYGKPFYYYK